jgi:hypothetical protein
MISPEVWGSLNSTRAIAISGGFFPDAATDVGGFDIQLVRWVVTDGISELLP